MTYNWTSASTIFRMRCYGRTKTGWRCQHEKFITTHEAPNGWLCHQHQYQNNERGITE